MDTDEDMDGLLGDLEAAVMDVVWARGAVSVREVREALRPERPLAYTTVMTVMSRLAEKGILLHERQGRAFIYRPAEQGRLGFLRQQARLKVRRLLGQFGDLAVAEFVDELSEQDGEHLAALARLVAEYQQPDESS